MANNEINLGRWLSPDLAGMAAADPTNPQSWNMYAYVLNNPESNIDPSGLSGCNADDANSVDTTSVPSGPGIIQVTSWASCPGPSVGTANTGATPSLAPVLPASGNAGGGWWGTFAKSLVTNFPSTTWHSLTNREGCLNQFFSNAFANVRPTSPFGPSVGEAAGSVYAAQKFNQALTYAATTPSKTFDTPFLVYANNSSKFRDLLKASAEGLWVGLLTDADLAGAQALWQEIQAARAHQCD